MQEASFAVLSHGDVFLRLLSAAVCGFLLGLNRQIKGHSPGIRTFMLICVGTAGFLVIMLEMMAEMIGSGFDNVNVDPARIIDGVVGGIGFLGAGAIMKSGEQIKGTTTGACIWVSGALGLACGFGLYFHALLLTGITLFILIAILPIKKYVIRKVAISNSPQKKSDNHLE